MDPLAILLLVIVSLVVVAIVWLVILYNGLVRRRNAYQGAWSQIDVQLKRRHDLVPNLVETVKGYAGHEKDTLETVIRARNAAVSAHGVGDQIGAENALSGALGRLMVVVEQYPDLKANANFLALQEELTSTENRIGFARQSYNDSVMQYNDAIQVFPANLLAGWGGFKAEEYWQIEEPSERAAPEVRF